MLNSTGYVQSRRGEYTKVAALKVGLLRLNVLAGTRNKVQGTRYKVPGTRYKVQGTRYKVQGTWNLKWHEISKDMKSQMTSNLNPTPHISKFLRYSEFCYTGEFSAKDFFKTKQKWVSFIMSNVMNCWCSWNVKCRMLNVECSLFTTVHYCSQLFTNIHCSQLCTTNCSMFTVHNCSQLLTVHNCAQLFTNIHCSQLCKTVHNCSPFTVHNWLFTTVHCLFVS